MNSLQQKYPALSRIHCFIEGWKPVSRFHEFFHRLCRVPHLIATLCLASIPANLSTLKASWMVNWLVSNLKLPSLKGESNCNPNLPRTRRKLTNRAKGYEVVNRICKKRCINLRFSSLIIQQVCRVVTVSRKR